jgi:Fe-S oxidoreductase
MPVLRSRLLAALGIPKPKATAENCIIFGCYRPFTDPFMVRDYLRVLDLLEVDYTYLEQEYCCGVPLRMQKPGPERDAAVAESREFNVTNDSLARKKGARKLAYCCQGCAHAARSVFPGDQINHVYIPDLIFDRLESRKLRIEPMSIAYFEGCHTFARSAYPTGMVDWGRYRKRLTEVEGLRITDLPSTQCCKNSAQELIDRAVEMKADAVLCPCNACTASVGAAATDRIRMISLPELLLQALG